MSFRYKYLLADIYGWKWWTRVRPWVAVTEMIMIDWQISDREDNNNSLTQKSHISCNITNYELAMVYINHVQD